MPGRFVDYPVDTVHRLLEPGPVVLISTSDGRRANLMTNGFNMPVRHSGELAFVLGPWDHSFAALRDTRECVIGLPGVDLLERVVDVGNSTGASIDKWERFGLTPLPAETVGAPLIGECFANIECTVADDRLVDAHDLWIVTARRAWVDPDAPAAAEVHHRGNGTFSTNGEYIDLRERMTKWEALTRD